MTAAVRWYSIGFALGAAGASARARKGAPRLATARAAWREGILDGGFARTAFVGAFRRRQERQLRR